MRPAGRTAYDQVLQIARGVATNVDQEFRTAIASLQLLALSETLERGDLDGFTRSANASTFEESQGFGR